MTDIHRPATLAADASAPGPGKRYERYHAHVYFDAATVEQARTLCTEAATRFGVAMGRMHERPVGPHPRWSCQLTFDASRFDTLVPWLDVHRGGLTILIHPQTGDALADHTTHAAWLGEPATLDVAIFRR